MCIIFKTLLLVRNNPFFKHYNLPTDRANTQLALNDFVSNTHKLHNSTSGECSRKLCDSLQGNSEVLKIKRFNVQKFSMLKFQYPFLSIFANVNYHIFLDVDLQMRLASSFRVDIFQQSPA